MSTPTSHVVTIYSKSSSQSAVLAGTESQLLLFFKTPSNFVHPPEPTTLRWLLILTYTALIFSISSTVSSLVLTENFGDSLGLAKRLRKRIKKSRLRKLILVPRQQTRALATLAGKAAPRRWRWMEYHCEWSTPRCGTGTPWLTSLPAGIFTLVVSVLCLLVQILVYIWIQELVIVKAVIAVVGIFGMLPLLHFLPIRRGPQGTTCKEPEEIKPRSLEEGTAMAQPPVTGSPHTVVSMLPSGSHCQEPSVAA